jgi:hypothetical protein
MSRSRFVAAIAALVLPLCGPVSGAHATFHEMSIRELYPGSIAQPESEYVELQMWSPGQNFVKGHTLRTYDAGGAASGTDTFAANVPSGANQSTILLATPAAEAQFGVKADAPLGANALDPAGGGVCWEELDCVSWGGFSGKLPSPAGTPAAAGGIPDEMALRRGILSGCPTLLEAGDDHDNSAADFSATFPAPRPNSVAPTEHACATGGGSEGSGGRQGAGAPQTLFRRKPSRRTADRTPTFRFAADEAGVSFQCKVDRGAFKHCRSPFTTAKLSLGRHTFAVRARDDSGKVDPTPARYGFRVIAKH